jgi:multidrug efflux pump subunit AcrA (membrane-fusion protein)
MSKDLKPKLKLGQQASSRKRKLAGWAATLLFCGGAVFATYRYTGKTVVEVAVTKVKRGDFIIAVRSRGEVRSTRSIVLTAPQVPDLTIVKLAESGKPVNKGDVVVQFDSAAQEQAYLEQNTTVRTVEDEIVQTKTNQHITDELDGMNLMSSEFDVERAELDANKAEVLSEIEGEKNRIDVTVDKGALSQVKTTIGAHKVMQSADLQRMDQRKDKTVRDLDHIQEYLEHMVIRAPIGGVVNILPNFRASGSFGSSPPPFKEGDKCWTDAPIAEIPDASQMRMELKLEEVDRGKIQLGQELRIRVDAVPDKEFTAHLDWISPIAALVYKGLGMSDKLFPAFATLQRLDPRLQPGMSGTAEIVIERQANALLIPARASFVQDGKPAVYVQKGQNFQLRKIEIGKRNDNDIVVLNGLKEGEVIAIENPIEAARRAKKL